MPSLNLTRAIMKAPPAYDCGPVIVSVARVYKISPRLLLAPTRGFAKIARARHVAMYLAYTLGYGSSGLIGEQFGRDRTTVCYATQRVEDMRDNPKFDAAISTLEARLALPDSLSRPLTSCPNCGIILLQSENKPQ